jgi:hypothetical protein
MKDVLAKAAESGATALILLFLGMLLAFLGTREGCVVVPPVDSKQDTVYVYRVDTLVYSHVPEPEIRFIKVPVIVPRYTVDTFYVNDSVFVEVPSPPDTIYMEEMVNYYEDSIVTDKHTVEYRTHIKGEMITMDMFVTSKQEERIVMPVLYKPKWTAGIGLSTNLSVKGSIGHKGWHLEPVLNKQGQFQEMFLTKTFNLDGKKLFPTK